MLSKDWTQYTICKSILIAQTSSSTADYCTSDLHPSRQIGKLDSWFKVLSFGFNYSIPERTVPYFGSIPQFTAMSRVKVVAVGRNTFI